MQLEVFPDRLRLHRIDATKNMRRYYQMIVERDLFGGASLVREWGRIGSGGQICRSYHSDEGQAVNALAQIMTAKQKRGYVL